MNGVYTRVAAPREPRLHLRENRLNSGLARRVRSGPIINPDAWATITHPLFKGDHELELRSGVTLRLSRRYKDELFARLG